MCLPGNEAAIRQPWRLAISHLFRAFGEECYNFDRTWLDTLEVSEPDENGEYKYQSMGKMFLVKFGDRPYDPVWPVDIPEWDIINAPQIIGQLLHDAQPGFPIPVTAWMNFG